MKSVSLVPDQNFNPPFFLIFHHPGEDEWLLQVIFVCEKRVFSSICDFLRARGEFGSRGANLAIRRGESENSWSQQ